MSNKLCGECKYHNPISGICIKLGKKPSKTLPSCPYRPTNGDRIRQGGDYALAHFKSEHRCDVCAYAAPIDTAPACRRPEGKICFDGVLEWLNAPADACVKQNAGNDTQICLCEADNTESDAKDE